MKLDSLSEVFGGKVPGLNAPLRFKDAISNMEPRQSNQLDSFAFGNVMRQKDLSLFGDFDNDKKLNIFDCDPFDPSKQGKIHDFFKAGGEKVKGFFSSSPQRDFMVQEKALLIRPDEPPRSQQDWEATKRFGRAAVDKTGLALQVTGRGLKKFGKNVATGVGNVYQASGTPQYLKARQERLAAEGQIIAQARAEAIKEAAKQKYLQKGQQAFDKQMGRSQSPQWQYGPDRGWNFGQAPKSEFGQLTSGFQTGVGSIVPSSYEQKVGLMTGFGGGGGFAAMTGLGNTGLGSGVGAAELLVSGKPSKSFAQKVYDTIGGKPPVEEVQYERAPQLIRSQPVQVQQSLPIQPIPQRRIQSQVVAPSGPVQQGGMIYSPLSKRPVRYSRGPYEKHPRTLYTR